MKLLGIPAVSIDQKPVTETLAIKEQALLYYLAVTGEVHNRHSLAGLFWGDASEQKAKTSLRVALSGLRKTCPDHLAVTHLTVALDPESDYEVDAVRLEREALPSSQAGAEPTLAQLQTIAGLYRGEFLKDFFVEGTPAFEDWLLNNRSYYGRLALRALVSLAGRLMAQRAYRDALAILARWLEIEPWDEAAHRMTMLAYCRMGNLNAALAQYDRCVQLLESELGVEPMPETAALYERIQLARQNQPLLSLPEETPLVGRQPQLERLHQMLIDPACRLVTIRGLGGVGKTRLAMAAAREANQEYGVDFLNGIVFVPLASAASAETLPLALADALGLQLSGQSDPLADVLNFLAGREMLLVLDNFEQLLDGVGIVGKLLQRCPDIKLIVTSREPLQLAAEWRLSLEGLTYPPEDETGLNPETIASFEAIQLFVQAARQVRPNFSLTTENAPLLQRLCCMVDGVPLALRLSATWLRAMSLENIIQEVESGLDILETSMRDIPERQRSMRVIFGQAWTLLNEEEKRVFPALSVFRGGFDSAAVRAVAGAKPWLLAGLVDRGLLQLLPQNERYAIHELTRQYAAEKLEETEAETAAAQQHSQYYLSLIARYDPVVMGVMRQKAIAAIRPDIENIRQAWRWALENEALESLIESIDGLAAYFEVTGLFNDAIQHFGSAAERITRSAAAETAGPERKNLICRLLVKEMEFLELRGDYDQAQSVGDRLLTLAEGEAMTIFRADAHRVLGVLSRWAGELKASEKNLRTAAALYQQLGAARQLATTLDWLALTVSDYGQVDESLAILEEAAELHKQANNQRGLVFNKGQTAVVLVINGRLQESLAYQLEVLEEYQEMGYPLYIARTANNIGLVNIELGEFEDAVRYMEQGLQVQRHTGALMDSFNTLGNKGEGHLNLGQYREARHCFEEAQQYFKGVDAPLLESENLWRLASVLIRMGEYDRAQTALERCLELTPLERDAETFAFASGFLAQIHWRRGELEAAAAYFRQATVPYHKVRRLLGLAEFVNVPRALFALEQGDIDAAETIHQEMTPYLENAGRNPTIFLHKLLEGQIAAAKGSKEEAGEVFESLLETEIRPYQEAAVYYELWQLTAEAHYAQQAHTLYQHLAAHTPDTLYQTRLQTLQPHLPPHQST